ncbi:hypothetical protein [Streptomyces gardneri]|uniref:hypothetical protein n=1 Tax=Streptomyces gardneri TaxID=66892 RepID=UPI0036CC46A9
MRVEQSGQGSAVQSTVRQVGSALGAAVIGGLLSLQLAHTLPDHVDSVPGVPPKAASQWVEAARQSAGSAIGTLRAQGIGGPLGAAAPAAVSALDDGFAEATRTTLFAASGFLALGLIAALRIPGTRTAPTREVRGSATKGPRTPPTDGEPPEDPYWYEVGPILILVFPGPTLLTQELLHGCIPLSPPPPSCLPTCRAGTP